MITRPPSKMRGSPSKSDIHFFFTSSLCKILMRFCFISIVKRGYLFLLTFLPIKKNQEKKKLNKKRNPKKQDDIHEESLEDCPS